MPLVIQIAGTSGSGKSHLMRQFLAYLKDAKAEIDEQFIEGRAAPIGYCVFARGRNKLFIPGSYQVPTGGCDTISDIKQVYKLLDDHLKTGFDIVYEGLFCMNQTRGPQLAARIGRDYHVLQLTTPLATCLKSINDRRAERGEGELVNKSNTVDNYRRATNFCAVMREAGARVHKVSREEALDKLLEIADV